VRPATLGRVAGGLSAAVTLLGLWFWDHERSYAAAHPQPGGLADTLQWLGVAVTAAGLAGVLLSVVAVRLSADRPLAGRGPDEF